jgi:hypothetical protein
LCAGRPSLGAKLGLADDFPPNFFPITPPRNGNVGRGSRGLSESCFKLAKNSPPMKKFLTKK